MRIRRFYRVGARLAGKIMARSRRVAAGLSQPDPSESLLERLRHAAPPDGLSGRVVVITGSSRGIGYALAGAFAGIGARVVLNGRSADALGQAVLGVRERNGDVVGICADVATEEGARRLIREAINAFGAVDILINNAGVPGPSGRRAWEVTAGELAGTLGTNLVGPYLCAAAAVEWMIRNGVKGRIINVSSGAGQSAYPKLATYGISKCALEALSRHLAVDVGTSGIAVTTIALGSVRTEMTKEAFPWEVYQSLPGPESVIPVFLFVASAPAESVHGRTLAAWRFDKDAFAESMLCGPVASLPRLSFEPLRYRGQEISRNSGEIVVYDRGENSHGAPPAAIRALKADLETLSLHQYPDLEYTRLRRALSRHLDLPEGCFTFGNGSSEILERILRVFVHPGEEVISNDPGWFVFDRYCTMQGIINRKVPFEDPTRPGYAHHNLGGILGAIGVNTRMIYLINPGNLLGIGIRPAEFDRFLANVPAHLPIVVDEAYIEFSDNPEMLRTPGVILKTDRKVIGLRTFSKFYGLAGIRVGYAFASPDVLHLIDRLELAFSIPWISETAAVAALEDAPRNAEILESFRSERRFIEDSCRDMGLDFLPSETHLMFVESPCSPPALYNAFEKEGIFLSKSGYYAGKYVIFPVGTAQQNRRNVEILRSLL